MSDRLSGRALAAALGVNEKSVRNAVAEGRITKGKDGKFDLEECWSTWSRSTEPSRSRVRQPVRTSPHSAIRRLVRDEHPATFEGERTRKLKLENDETERRLIPIEDAIAAIDAIVGPIQSELAGVAPRVSDDVAIRRKVEDEINVVCGEISKRLHKAGVDLREGRDALASGSEDNPDGVGEEE